jgi:cathepsin D
MPLATLPASVQERMEKRQSEALAEENSGEDWAGTISIGTPAQHFLIDFDST